MAVKLNLVMAVALAPVCAMALGPNEMLVVANGRQSLGLAKYHMENVAF